MASANKSSPFVDPAQATPATEITQTESHLLSKCYRLKKAATHTRVFTMNNGQSPEMQLRDLRQLAERGGLEIVGEYCDEGVSGAKSSRPALDAMLNDAKRSKFHVLLIWELDRLGRSLTHLVRLLEDFKSWGVELVSFSEGLDFSTTTGKLLYQVISAFAEFERDCIRERVRGGMRNARAKGKRIGPPPLRFLGIEDRKAIAKTYWQNKRSFRDLAKQFGTSIGTVQRCVLAYQKVFPSAPVKH
jgi:DNA invertase Pin-like site-specific DNA recombinase